MDRWKVHGNVSRGLVPDKIPATADKQQCHSDKQEADR